MFKPSIYHLKEHSQNKLFWFSHFLKHTRERRGQNEYAAFGLYIINETDTFLIRQDHTQEI